MDSGGGAPRLRLLVESSYLYLGPTHHDTPRIPPLPLADPEEVPPGSSSPHANRVGLSKKEDGSWEAYIDYRYVNNATVSDPYPLLRIGNLAREVRQSRFLAALALRAGCGQIRLEPEGIFYTASRCMGGLSQFTTTPLGYPSTGKGRPAGKSEG
ncbi:MAG: hypothetical protein KVP17_003278 [Porospora cf. gigantea B]|uniref:uncharacterized protein n=1 Tax=Porospora cf. gigantea B TaxID=2853592 RepID=UPI003571DBEA|nr:MAG: hypothetical protein KVP17_003278 [Porospora cf. gigantea B]